MPRRLLRDRLIVEDEWQYLTESPDTAAPMIVPFDQWTVQRDAWIGRGGRLGVVLKPADLVERLSPDLSLFSLVACDFSGPAEGRGYTQARLLRERYQFTGELRAIGFVHQDQLFFMARCGFNSFELPDADIEAAHAVFSTFTAAYQPSNDRGLGFKLQHEVRGPA